MNIELNVKVALAMGWFKRDDGIWLNSFGSPVSDLPDFSGDRSYTGVVVRHFESFSQTINGNKQAFFARYNEELTEVEICELALEILGEKVESR